MFGLKKKLKEEGKKGAENTRNFNAAEEKMRDLDIDKKMYSSFLKAKGIGRLNNTPELVDEFLSNEWIIKTDLECLLTLDEAAKYTGIGVNKLREISNDDDCDFILWNGSRRMFKKEKLKNYLYGAYSI